MLKKTALVSLLIFSCLSTAQVSEALYSSSKNNADANNELELVVGVEDVAYFPLFDFFTGSPTFTTELLDEFASQNNYKFIYYPMPVKRFGMWLFEKDIDLKFPDNSRWNESEEINKLAKDKLTYSDTVLDLVAGTITVDPSVDDTQDIKVLGTLLGFFPTLWIEHISNNSVKLYETSSTLMLLQQLVRGQLDAVNLEPNVVNHYLRKLNKPKVTINKNFKYEIYSYHLSTRQHPRVIAQFNEFLKNNKSFVEGLKKKYQILDPEEYIR